jgi:hypothetical protein
MLRPEISMHIWYNRRMIASIPASLQGVLWSAKTNTLDIQNNRIYIINQILSFGTLEQIRWLIQTYSKQIVREVFLQTPMKIYTKKSFNFSKLILDVSESEAPNNRYDKTLPRYIG